MLFVERKAIRPYTIEAVDGKEKTLRLEPGQLCMYSIYSMFKDETYFPNSDKFDPERFSDENKEGIIHPGAYIPFGIGPRNCIGNNNHSQEYNLVFLFFRGSVFINRIENVDFSCTEKF